MRLRWTSTFWRPIHTIMHNPFSSTKHIRSYWWTVDSHCHAESNIIRHSMYVWVLVFRLNLIRMMITISRIIVDNHWQSWTKVNKVSFQNIFYNKTFIYNRILNNSMWTHHLWITFHKTDSFFKLSWWFLSL